MRIIFQNFYLNNIYVLSFLMFRVQRKHSIHIPDLFGKAILSGGAGIELIGLGTKPEAVFLTRLDTSYLSDIMSVAGQSSGMSGFIHMTGIYISGFVANLQREHIAIINPHYGIKMACSDLRVCWESHGGAFLRMGLAPRATRVMGCLKRRRS